MATRDQHFDYQTLQDHDAPKTVSDLLFKAALAGEASEVWYGTVRIQSPPGADANQTSRNLLLSEHAKAAPIPVLEIEQFDVLRCSHGATAGPIDEEQLFYLESRGVEPATSEHLLVEPSSTRSSTAFRRTRSVTQSSWQLRRSWSRWQPDGGLCPRCVGSMNPGGRGSHVHVDGNGIAVANVGGELFALDDIARMTAGRSVRVRSSATRWSARATAPASTCTGRVRALPAVVPVKTYPVEVEGDEVRVIEVD